MDTLNKKPANTACPVCGGRAHRTDRRLGGYDLFLCRACKYHFAYEAFKVPVDYDQILASDQYRQEQVDPFLETPDPATFTQHPTYRPFFEEITPRHGETLLDFGCGVGRFCHAAALAGWQVTGIDTSIEAVKIGNEKGSFQLRKGSLEEEIASGASYDVITAFEVMEHLADPVDHLRKMARLLRPGGHIFITVPNWFNPLQQKAARLDLTPPVHLGFHQKSSVREMLKNAGLIGITVGEIGGGLPKPGVRGALSFLVRKCRGRVPVAIGVWGHARI